MSVVVPDNLRLITPYVLLEQEDWFEPEIRFVRSLFLAGMIVVDVGANYGIYSLTAALLVGPKGRVISFEPTPDVADALTASVEQNGFRNVQIRRVALSDVPGEGRFAVTTHAELNRLDPKAVDGTSTAITVQIDTLDNSLRELGVTTPDFIKIDVEGNGLKVLRGAERTLRTGNPLVMFEIDIEGTSFDRSWVEAFDTLGYGLYRLLPQAGFLVPLDREGPVDPYALNLFAAKPELAAGLAERGLLADPALVAAGQTTLDWTGWVDSVPYARARASAWTRRPKFWAKSGEKAHYAALECFVDGLPAPGRSAWARFAALNAARRHALLAVNESPDLARVLTFARLEYELGQRGSALLALHSLRKQASEEAIEVPQVPFLPPIPYYDRVAWDGQDTEWLVSAVLEGYIKLHKHSDCYNGGEHDDLLVRLASSKYASLEMTRRRVLRRLVFGFPEVPFDRDRLVTAAPDHLNAPVWATDLLNRA